jgi:hypothetical protein
MNAAIRKVEVLTSAICSSSSGTWSQVSLPCEPWAKPTPTLAKPTPAPPVPSVTDMVRAALHQGECDLITLQARITATGHATHSQRLRVVLALLVTNGEATRRNTTWDNQGGARIVWQLATPQVCPDQNPA